MQVITIGKRLLPTDQIALVEVFDPASNPEFQPGNSFKGRIVLLDRDAVLTEMTPQEFAIADGLYLLADDNVAVNQSIAFGVEIFASTENFKPSKSFRTRLKWRDLNGNEQSKLLVAEPEAVVTELSRRQPGSLPRSKQSPQRPKRPSRGSRKAEAVRS